MDSPGDRLEQQAERGARSRGKGCAARHAPPHPRRYKRVEPEDGTPDLVSLRRIPLEGASNFRDLGGYETSDGRRVRWGALYRSDALSELTDADVERVGSLGIRLVCDLRSPAEREAEPNRLPGPADGAPDVLAIPVHGTSVEPVEIRERIRSGMLDGIDFGEMLVDANRAFVREFAPQYAEVLRSIASLASAPALVHCTAGKDRAGFAAALVLIALGVPRETVLYDYLLTNVYTAEKTRQTLRSIHLFSFFRTDPARVEPLLQARSEYLLAAFDTIDTEWGSTDAYLREGLRLDEPTLEELRAALLTSN